MDREFLKTNLGKIPDFQLVSFLSCLYQKECIEFQLFLNLRIERQAYHDLKPIYDYLFKTNLGLEMMKKEHKASPFADHNQTLKQISKSHDKHKRYILYENYDVEKEAEHLRE